MPLPERKEVTFVVEFTCRINKDVDPSDVTFDIDPGWIRPVVGDETVGVTTGYTTTAHFNDENV